jgi:hypothetical protein
MNENDIHLQILERISAADGVIRTFSLAALQFPSPPARAKPHKNAVSEGF